MRTEPCISCATVRTGQMLSIKNVATGEETNCTVRDINAVPSGLMEIGLEFYGSALPLLARGLSAA